jgi:hypothetical protein
LTHERLYKTVARRDEGTDERNAWTGAARAARIAVEALYSPDLDDLVAGIGSGDQQSIEAAIVFLEVDPWVFRSGYTKDTLLRRLSRAPLGPDQQERVRQALLAALVRGPRREFPAMLRLAHHVRSPSFAADVRAVSTAGPDGRQRAALRMLASIEGTRRSRQHRRGRRG